MIFENDSISFHLLDVLALDQGNVNMYNSGRNFSALSFRIQADTVLESAGREWHLKDHSVTFVPARLDYRRIAKEDKVIVIHLDVLDCHGDKIESFLPEDPEKMEALFRRILDIWNKKEISYKHQCAAVLYEIFGECYRQTAQPGEKHPKIQNSVSYIRKHYRDPSLSVAKVAEQSYMSQVYFRKLFKEAYGISPQKYIIKLRIQYAIGLLDAGYYSLKEIAALSGYTDYKYFSVEFKKLLGVSPSEYDYHFRLQEKSP